MAPDLDSLRAALRRPGGRASELDQYPETVLPAGRKLRPAGVLAPIVAQEDGLHLLLTKRSSALKHHPGQIAFPGGKQDEGDASVTDAALREAQEEIGLPTGDVQVLGTLPAHETVTGFIVTPVIGLVTRPFQIVPERGEVDEVFSVPLAHVTSEANFVIQSRQWRGQQRSYFAVPYGPYYIWGATARMLRAWTDQISR